jgi:hypothetical protein
MKEIVTIPYTTSPLDAYRGSGIHKDTIQNFIMNDVKYIATIKDTISIPVGTVLNLGDLGKNSEHFPKHSVSTSKS